jgi:predicted RNA-binding Zn-ribbon protein involved in translation (DUF1610 family)
MPRATCRCGEILDVPDGTERVVCPKCSARVRIRQGASAGADDRFIRFACPCGRRLKVNAQDPPPHGKCPDCGRVVPVPASSVLADPEGKTEELSSAAMLKLDEWAKSHTKEEGGLLSTSTRPAATRSEAGLRVCPSCGKPIHLGASQCRECGTPVPKR